MSEGYRVRVETNSWLLRGTKGGDPPRTMIRENGMVYATPGKATAAVHRAMKTHPYQKRKYVIERADKIGELTDSELQVMQHAMGFDEYGQGTGYRNRFVCMPDLEILGLCSRGLMREHEEHRDSSVIGGKMMRLYYVTEIGLEVLKSESPVPFTKSRSQRRYEEWLRVSDIMTFRQFMEREKEPKVML